MAGKSTSGNAGKSYFDAITAHPGRTQKDKKARKMACKDYNDKIRASEKEDAK